MRLHDRRAFSKPEIIIIPMIDIMFFLLVFFMLSTLYMVNLKSLPINLPIAKNAEQGKNINYLVTLKKDGSLWLEDKSINRENLLLQAKNEKQNNPQFAVIIRADQSLSYGKIITLLDDFKSVGVTRVGLAAETGAKN